MMHLMLEWIMINLMRPIDDFEDIHDLPTLEKEDEPLFEVSCISVLSAVLLIMNLKVKHGFSNTAITLV